jgi:ribosome recycling factor
MMIMANTKTAFTAATLAAEFGTNPKELRKFLRTPESGIEPVGKGARYNIELTPPATTKLRKKFQDWSAAAEKAREERKQMLEDAAAKKLNVLTIAVESEVVETDEVPAEELDFENMTDADIEAALDEIVAEKNEA